MSETSGTFYEGVPWVEVLEVEGYREPEAELYLKGNSEKR